MTDLVEEIQAENTESKIQELKNFFDLISNEVKIQLIDAESEKIKQQDINPAVLNHVEEKVISFCSLKAYYLSKKPKSIEELRPIVESMQSITIFIHKVGTFHRPVLAQLGNSLPSFHETSKQFGDGINHGGQGGW